MSAMADMSRAIRETMEWHAPGKTLKTIPTDLLRDYVQIIGAFYADISEELERRENA